MRLKPGSFAWLVAHDLRLSWRRFRGMFGALRPQTVAALVVLGIVTIHLLAWPITAWFAEAGPQDRWREPALASALVFIFSWLVSQSLTSATRVLFTRGDLDLLIASPLPARRLLAARALAIAVESLAGVGMFILPFANVMALRGLSPGLALYPVLISASLLASALGLSLAVLLFVVVGPRRTRLVSQILATVLGAGFVLALQAANVLPPQTRTSLLAGIQRGEAGTLYDRKGPLFLPVRAALGHSADLAIWIALSLAVFALVAVLLGDTFVRSALRSAGAAASAGPRVRASRGGDAVFRAGVGAALRRKEWRLICRDPYLVSQIFLQVIYTLPISIVLWRSQGPGGSVAFSVAPAIVVISAQVAASLAWLTISSEDAPDFLSTAPVTRSQIERRKLEAVGLPLALFLAGPLLGLAWVSLEIAAWTFVFVCGAALSTSLLNLWHPMPGRRGDLLRRHSQSKFIALMEHLLSLLWALAMVMAVLESWLALIPIGLAGAVLWFNRPRPLQSGGVPLAARTSPAR
ncbi:MAG: type transport system permease protein [Hyphomicrobiales bacterium]|nr:type transport system permease protein [Hyphomicrobiales bacterium]